MWIKSKNGAVVEVTDEDLGKRALKQGHEVFESDPREKPKKAAPRKSSKSDE